MLDETSLHLLIRLAGAQLSNSSVGKDLVAHLTSDALEIEFGRLVDSISTLADESKENTPSISIFFTDEAIKSPMKLPNYYWFWKVVQLCCFAAGSEKCEQSSRCADIRRGVYTAYAKGIPLA